MVNRRSYLKRLAALTTVGTVGGLAGCSGEDEPENTDQTEGDQTEEPTPEINWIMNPAQEEIDITVQYQPLFDYLEENVGVKINGQPTASYSGTVQELRRAEEGDRVFADVSPGAVAQIPDEIDVTGMRVAYGAEKYFSLITTTADSDIEELADLEGEIIATGSPTSVSGTMFPLLMLKNAGLDIGDAPGGSPEDFEIRATDHTTAREQLIADDRIAAATTGAFSTAAHVPQEQFDEMSQDFVDISAEYGDAGTRDPELRLLAVSKPIPRAPIVGNSDWDDSLKEELRQSMIDAPQEAFEHESQEALAEELGVDPALLDKDEGELSDAEVDDVELVEDHGLWFSGIVPASESDYDPVAELGQELGLDWANL
jgi:phosphonate transport system substrate-binding protein